MQYFFRSTISLSLLTAFLFGGLLQAQDQEIRIKIRKQDGDKVIELDETIMGDEDFDVEAWLNEMGLDKFESDFQNLDVDVEIGGDGERIWIEENGEETTIKIDNTDGEKKIMMIQSGDPEEIKALMEKYGNEEGVIIIDGEEMGLHEEHAMDKKIMKRIKIIEDEKGSHEYEIVKEYFSDIDEDKGTLGVMMEVDDDNQKAIITEVLSGSAAEKVGLKVDDEIVGVNDTRVSTYKELVDALASFKKGDVVKIWYQRQIQDDLIEMVKTVELHGMQKRMLFYGANPNPAENVRWVESTRGFQGEDCCAPGKAAKGSDDTRGYLGVEIVDTPNGVTIDAVAPGSAASKSNMAEGMVIQTVDRKTVESSDELIDALKDKLPGDKIKVKYKDETGKTWKEKLRLQSKPSAFAKSMGCCAPADKAACCPGPAGKLCTIEEIKACCPELLEMCTPEEIAACTPEQLKKCLADLAEKKLNQSDERKFIEIRKEQNGESTKIVIIEKDKTNNKDSATIKVIISETADAETKLLDDSENAPKADLKNLELEELMFYPNPSDGNVQLSFRGDENDYNIRITDMSGKDIYRGKTGRVSSFTENIDISANPEGVYLLQIYSDTQILTKKIIVK